MARGGHLPRAFDIGVGRRGERLLRPHRGPVDARQGRPRAEVGPGHPRDGQHALGGRLADDWPREPRRQQQGVLPRDGSRPKWRLRVQREHRRDRPDLGFLAQERQPQRRAGRLQGLQVRVRFIQRLALHRVPRRHSVAHRRRPLDKVRRHQRGVGRGVRRDAHPALLAEGGQGRREDLFLRDRPRRGVFGQPRQPRGEQPVGLDPRGEPRDHRRGLQLVQEANRDVRHPRHVSRLREFHLQHGTERAARRLQRPSLGQAGRHQPLVARRDAHP